jgi:hypothetical protein
MGAQFRVSDHETPHYIRQLRMSLTLTRREVPIRRSDAQAERQGGSPAVAGLRRPFRSPSADVASRTAVQSNHNEVGGLRLSTAGGGVRDSSDCRLPSQSQDAGGPG